MEGVVLVLGKLLEFLGWTGSLTLLLVLYALCGVRVVWTGFRGVYFRLGIPVGEVGPGVHWRPFPVYRLRVPFCADQLKDLKPQEVTTKDGITCCVEGAISYRVNNATALETDVDDADEQMRAEIAAEIREWAAANTYEECRATELGRKIVPAAVRRAKRWGIEVFDINITTFAPANPEARLLVYLPDVARKRAESADVFLEALESSKERWRTLGVNPSVLLASIAGVPMSVVSNADQLTGLREDVASLAERLDDQKPQPDTLERVGAAIAEYIPGMEAALALRGSNGDAV